MKEKKQFFIPKNYDKKFEWIPGISGWQHLAFVPVVALDYFVFLHTPFSLSNKVTMIGISLALPWFLMGTHPVRENVPLYKHLYWKIKFLSRQRLFHYKKEGYVNDFQTEETSGEGKQESTSSKKVYSRLNSFKRNRERITDHSRQQNGEVSESVGN
ncbi:hypothetical protein [Bacillus xiapuensis]|uniref:Conjugal transfer protein n=1 Tax=Bacillus xiapuensis TaxID=2014075 RepID=A0ABU6N5L3_9BACI|nr:hypothetical protein [Bacillus xiapuensis]